MFILNQDIPKHAHPCRNTQGLPGVTNAPYIETWHAIVLMNSICSSWHRESQSGSNYKTFLFCLISQK